MSDRTEEHALHLVTRAKTGLMGNDALDLAALFERTAQAGQAETRRADREKIKRTEAEERAWALAYIVGELMDGATVDDIVDDLPSEARRMVIAVRHRTGPWKNVPPQDQYGMLPTPPARASVMRSRVRDVEADAWVTDPDQRVIEG